MWAVRVGGGDGELRPRHYIYVYSIESKLIMRVRYVYSIESRLIMRVRTCRPAAPGSTPVSKMATWGLGSRVEGVGCTV